MRRYRPTASPATLAGPGRAYRCQWRNITRSFQRKRSTGFWKVHHQNIWPLIRLMIDSSSNTGNPAIFEGAALRPELISPLLGNTVAGVFLHAGNDFSPRGCAHARYDEATASQRRIIDAFIERSLRENTEMLASAQQHRVPVVDVTKPQALETLVADLAGRVTASFVIKRRATEVSPGAIAALICPVTTR